MSDSISELPSKPVVPSHNVSEPKKPLFGPEDVERDIIGEELRTNYAPRIRKAIGGLLRGWKETFARRRKDDPSPDRVWDTLERKEKDE